MSTKIAVPPEDGAAGGALIRLKIGVCQQVGFQIASLVETSAAGGAFVGRLLHVENLVHCQSATLAKALPALTTFEGLLLAVNVLMIPEVILSSECLAADVAGERAFVSVRAFVDEQIVAFGEVPRAVLANELLLGPGRPPGDTQQPPVEDSRQEGIAHAQRGHSQGRHGVTQGQNVSRHIPDITTGRRLHLRPARIIVPLGFTFWT